MAGAHSQRIEAISRGVRMLRTALGPAIASWLDDPGVVEVMLNPDGRLWIDRLAEGLGDTGERLFASPPLVGLRHFQTLIAADDRLFVGADGRLYAFTLP